MSPLYVFGITRDVAEPFDVEGHLVEFIRVGGVAAAVEQAAAAPQVSEAVLRTQHEIVLRIGAVVNELLPVRFGALVDRDELDRLLAGRKDAVAQALDLVSGRVQMTIRVRDSAPGKARPDAPVSSQQSSGTAYLEARRSAATQPVAAAAAPAIAAVRHLVVAERHDRSQRGGSASVYHLIDRADVDSYRTALSRLDSSSATVTGPWPPFAFAPDLWP